MNDGRTGIHFRPGDPTHLAEKLDWSWTHPEELETMGNSARLEFEAKCTSEKEIAMLSQIYQQALSGRSSVQTNLSRSIA